MALLRFQANGLWVGVVRNQKCGSTSALNYVGQCFWGVRPDQSVNYTAAENELGPGTIVGWHGGFEDFEKELLACDVRVAVYRDPVEKLLSGYAYCKYRRYHNLSLNEFLDSYYGLIQSVEFIWLHCRTNTALCGADRSIYTHCFELRQLNTEYRALIEQLTGKKTERCHLRNTKRKESCNDEQREKIMAIMAEDYKNGWVRRNNSRSDGVNDRGSI